MTPMRPPGEIAVQSLVEDGVVNLDDMAIGDHVEEMERRGFTFLSPYGLEYYDQHVLKNPLVRQIIESLFPRCMLGHWLRYNALPGHIECFRRGGQKAGLRVLVLQQWAKGSRVAFFTGSHRHDLPTKKGPRSLHETTHNALIEAGCQLVEKEFPDGGLIIRDARLYVESQKGYAITFIFATNDVLGTWPKIVLPNDTALIQQVKKLESVHIGLNVEFEDAVKNKEGTL